MGLKCLPSLVRTSVEPISFILHDDGTLTADDIAQLRDHLPIAAFLSRKEADERVLPLLKNYPACLRYRTEHVFGVKLFDLLLLGGSEIYYCDSDILFFAPHRGLFTGVLDRTRSAFTQDCQHAYAIGPKRLWPFSRLHLRTRLNSGLFAFRPEKGDLAFMEYFFATFGDFLRQGLNWWIEQTAWSALSARAPARAYDPGQIAMAGPQLQYDPRHTLAIHFVGAHRKTMATYENVQRETESPVDIRLIRAPVLNAAVWYGEKAAGRVQRGLARFRTRSL